MSGHLVTREISPEETRRFIESLRDEGPEPPQPEKKKKPKRSEKPFVFTLARPSRVSVLIRTLAWIIAAVRFELRRRWWEIFSRGEREAEVAHRMRNLVQKLGAPAAFIVRQFSMRVDLIPESYALELARLDPAVPPLPIEVAAAQIAAAARAPLSSFLEVLDPTPIDSNVVCSIYQGRLKTGDRVIFRVLRPDANLRINRERLAFDRFLRLLSIVLYRRSAAIQRVRDDLAPMTIDQLDFVRIARAQELLIKEVEAAKLTGVGVPTVHFEYCDHRVIATEFSSGVWLHEVIAARENEDEKALATLAEMGIDPDLCGRRLLRLMWWLVFEVGFLLTAPDARQFVVRRGGTLMLVDPGVMAVLGKHRRRLLDAALDRLGKLDVEGAGEALLALVHPLPRIEAHVLSARVQQELWTRLIAVKNRDAPGWERSGTGLWVGFQNVLRGAGVALPHEVSRAIQSFCVFGDIAAGLRPRLNLFRELARYRRRSLARSAREARRFVRDPTKRGGSRFLARPSDLREIMRRTRQWVDTLADRSPLTYLSLSAKGSFSLSQVLWAALVVVKIIALYMVGKVVWTWMSGGSFDLGGELSSLAAHPVFRAGVVFLLIATARRILFRLDDMERK